MKILQRYFLRETVIPAAFALATLLFMLLIQEILSKLNEFAGILSFSLLSRIIVYFLPSFFTLAIPMSVLIGVLLGMARLTVDGEIKACRTHGINLLGMVAPILILGVLTSGVVFFNCLYFAPWMIGRGMEVISDLKYEIFSSIQPGRLMNDLEFRGAKNIVLYFGDKDPATGEMKKVYMNVEADNSLTNPDSAQKNGAKGKEAKQKSKDKPSDAVKASGATAAGKPASGDGNEATSATMAAKSVKAHFFASTGKIMADPASKAAGLTLQNGSIHIMPDLNDPRYTVMHFKTMNLVHDIGLDEQQGTSAVKSMAEAMTLGDLHRQIAGYTQASEQAKTDSSKRAAHKRAWILLASELWRISVSLACIAFVLIALPLAIYIRPSGKSVGITIAFALIAFYYSGMYYGTMMTRKELLIGPVMIFLPNAILSILGILMLRRAVQR